MKGREQRLKAAFAQESREHLARVRELLPSSTGDESARVEIHRRVHSLKGAARAVGASDVEHYAHDFESALLAYRDQPENIDVAELAAMLDELEDLVTTYLDGAEGGQRLSETSAGLARENADPDTLKLARISMADVDRVIGQAGDCVTQVEAIETGLRELARRVAGVSVKGPGGQKINLAAEISGMAEQAWRAGGTAAQAQKGANRLRLVPVEAEFGDLRQQLRRLLQQQGRNAEIRIVGMDIRVDRRVLQEIKDAFWHLCSNAIAHGVRDGGTLQIRFHVEQGLLHLQVEDDMPLPADELLSRAQAQGLVDKNFTLDGDAAILELLCRPGFSSRDEADTGAGRGMGLPAVAECVRRLEGRLQLEQSGTGKCFSVSVPQHIVARRLIMVECGPRALALPVRQVKKVLRPSRKDIAEACSKGGISHDDRFWKLVNLESLIDPAVGHALSPDAAILLLDNDEQRFAMAVDGLLTVRSEMIRSIMGARPLEDVLLGGVILQDSTVCLVLDGDALVARATHYAGPKASIRQHGKDGREVRPARQSPHILLVDDSITTRTLQISLLEEMGYRVSVAVDGVEGWERLQASDFDLVITDIEMPRLDGFALLDRIRKDDRLRHLPVVIVSSRSDDRDRKRGMEAGADAYIVKQGFDNRRMLDTVAGFLRSGRNKSRAKPS